MLGPNALGMEHQMIARLLLVGHYIATATLTDPITGKKNPVLIHDPKTNIFRPEAFDVDAWRRAYLSLRRPFGIRFDRASQTTFETYRRSLRVAPESIKPGRAFSAIQSMYNSVPGSVPPEVPHGTEQINISTLEGSRWFWLSTWFDQTIFQASFGYKGSGGISEEAT